LATRFLNTKKGVDVALVLLLMATMATALLDGFLKAVFFPPGWPRRARPHRWLASNRNDDCVEG
jgi:hypothetical protein